MEYIKAIESDLEQIVLLVQETIKTISVRLSWNFKTG